MRIYNHRDSDLPIEAMNVDRRTPWGNPFVMVAERDRNAVCDQFEAYAIVKAQDDPTWLDPLRGHSLICWCTPLRCHAETLMRLANQEVRPPATGRTGKGEA